MVLSSSQGCILFVLAFFTHPFQNGGNLAIINCRYDIPEHHPYSKYLLLLIKRLFTVNSVKRPDINQVLQMVEQWEQILRDTPNGVKKKVKDKVRDKEKSNSKRDKDKDNNILSKSVHSSSNTLPVAEDSNFDADFAEKWNPFPSPAASELSSGPKAQTDSNLLSVNSQKPVPPKRPSAFMTAQLFDLSHLHSNENELKTYTFDENQDEWASFEQPIGNQDYGEFSGIQPASVNQSINTPTSAPAESIFDSFNWSLVKNEPKSAQLSIKNPHLKPNSTGHRSMSER